MKPRVIKGIRESYLRKAWFGDLPVNEIAARIGIGASTIKKFWIAEKAAGRLPALPAPRPYFPEVKSLVDPVPGETVDCGECDDDAPVHPIPKRDPLLAALIKNHREKSQPQPCKPARTTQHARNAQRKTEGK
jgi:hypothetical protein